MRESRLSGSEGGGSERNTGLPTPILVMPFCTENSRPFVVTSRAAPLIYATEPAVILAQ